MSPPAKAKGYLCRAAFKLLDLDEKFHLARKGRAKVLDPQSTHPGSQSQVAAARGAIVVAADVFGY